MIYTYINSYIYIIKAVKPPKKTSLDLPERNEVKYIAPLEKLDIKKKTKISYNKSSNINSNAIKTLPSLNADKNPRNVQTKKQVKQSN